MKNVFFSRNGVTLNYSLCFFIHYIISFPQSGKVYSDLCYFHKVKIDWKKNRNCGKLYIKIKIIVIFLFPQNRKCYISKIYFHKMERYLMICITSKEWKILEAETVPISSKREISQVFFYFYIYLFQFHKVGNISPMVLFPRRGKKFNDLLYHFQNAKNITYRNCKLFNLSKTV